MAAVVGLCGAAGAGTWLSVHPSGSAVTPPGPTRAHRVPVVKRAAQPWARWTITEQYSAQSVLVLQVETTHLNDATKIAVEIAAPLHERYAEILIYFHRPGRPDTLPPRRVQWSRTAGYVETDYEH